MRRRFFVERFANGAARLEGDAARHLGRVLRAEPGQLYELSDGESVFLARLERVSSHQADFALLESLPASAPRFETSLLLAIVKFDRFEWALEKATELVGATEGVYAEQGAIYRAGNAVVVECRVVSGDMCARLRSEASNEQC